MLLKLDIYLKHILKTTMGYLKSRKSSFFFDFVVFAHIFKSSVVLSMCDYTLWFCHNVGFILTEQGDQTFALLTFD